VRGQPIIATHHHAGKMPRSQGMMISQPKCISLF
jgi:hypothetical protein